MIRIILLTCKDDCIMSDFFNWKFIESILLSIWEFLLSSWWIICFRDVKTFWSSSFSAIVKLAFVLVAAAGLQAELAVSAGFTSTSCFCPIIDVFRVEEGREAGRRDISMLMMMMIIIWYNIIMLISFYHQGGYLLLSVWSPVWDLLRVVGIIALRVGYWWFFYNAEWLQ